MNNCADRNRVIRDTVNNAITVNENFSNGFVLELGNNLPCLGNSNN